MLCQHKYILDILTRAGMTSCKPVDTPVSTSKVTILSNVLFSNPTRFHQIVGALQYLTFTRSNIYFAINRVYQFMYGPTDSHRGVVKCILHYLKGTTSYGFVHGFTDAFYIGSIDYYKSTGNLVFLVRCRFYESQASNAQLLAPLQRLSI